MELMDNETLVSETRVGNNRILLTNFRLIQTRKPLVGKETFVSFPLENLDSIVNAVKSYPALLGIGVALLGLGAFLFDRRLDGAVILLALGAVFVLLYLLTRKRAIMFRSNASVIYIYASRKGLDEFARAVERQRWHRVKSLYERTASFPAAEREGE